MRSPVPVVARAVRRILRRGARRSPLTRRALVRIRSEADRALRDRRYDAGYFGGRGGDYAGYERYDRASSHAQETAFVVWRHLDVGSVLEVGCALGYAVEALRELGVEARGVDVNQWALDNAGPGIRSYLSWGDVTRGLPVADSSVDLVIAFETLEHLEPSQVPGALVEIARVTRFGMLATIPSFGPNGGGGPDGFLVGKVRDDRRAHYEALGAAFTGPIPTPDLAVDGNGHPVHGHLTIASFAWWTQRFAEVGLVRRPVLEGEVQNDLERLGLAGAWNLYALEKAGCPLPRAQRTRDEVAALVERWAMPAGADLVAGTRDGPPPFDVPSG